MFSPTVMLEDLGAFTGFSWSIDSSGYAGLIGASSIDNFGGIGNVEFIIFYGI